MANGWHRKRTGTEADKARTREYNSAEHKAARKAGAALVASGRACCWRCGQPIPPGSKWHVGHGKRRADGTRPIMGPEHERCNLHQAAVDGARARNRGVAGSVRVAERITRLVW